VNYLSIDYLIVYTFLIISVIIGIRAGKGVKNIRDYAIGNKSFTTVALILTLLATNFAGASVMNGPARIFSSGIIITTSLLAVGISFVLSGLLLAPKFILFNDCLTLGDLMKKFYGSLAGIIAGLLGLINAVLLLGMELYILGIMGENLLGIPATWSITVGGLLLALYTAYGGIRSVTQTDIFQFVTLAIFLPILAYKAVERIGSIETLLGKVPSEKLQVFNHKNFSFYLTLFLMWLVPAGLVDIAIIQRLLMGKTGNQLRNQYIVVGIADFILRLLLLVIGLSAIVLYPHLEAKQVIPHLVHTLLPVGIKGLVIAGLLAVGISTIDSYLHAAGLTAVHDVIIPIWKPKNTDQEVTWARWATLAISLIGIYIGLRATDALGLMFSALEATAPLLMFPLFSRVMGLQTNQKDFYLAFFATMVAFAISKIALPEAYDHFSILIGLATNGLFLFGSYWIRHKGASTITTKG
jgi:SSS family solute:Na+ symporter